MSAITTHILDVSQGRPAKGITVILELYLAGAKQPNPIYIKSGSDELVPWQELAKGESDNDGRIKNLLPEEAVLVPGIYRLSFDTASYFKALGTNSFYPCVSITFEIKDSKQHYHVPLLLSPFGYSTYRGS
jgi:5-hydroxyisourate hydrolase